MKYVAVDIGSTKCKIVAGSYQDGLMRTELLSKFKMNPVWKNGQFVWNTSNIFSNIVEGLKKAMEADYIAIDSFPSDFVLLDASGNLLGPAVSFRDQRSERAVNVPSDRELFFSTGHVSYKGDTVSQLAALASEDPELLNHADSFLFLPDYFNYLLTGVKTTERSMASASNLVSAVTGDWDFDIIRELGVPMRLFGELSDAGRILGPVKDEIAKELGYAAQVVLAPSYDKNASLLSVAEDEQRVNFLTGIGASVAACTTNPVVTEDAYDKGFITTIVGPGRFSVSKRIYGLSMIDKLKNEALEGTSYDQIMEEAKGSEYYTILDLGSLEVNKATPLADTINEALDDKISSRSDVANVLYRSIANSVSEAVNELEELLDRKFTTIVVSGGAVSDSYLAMLIAMMSSRDVLVASEDASAVGLIAFMVKLVEEVDEDSLSTALETGFIRRKLHRLG